MAKINIGKMPCETCGNHVTVKKNENDTLSYRCDECDAAPYAKLGTVQHVFWTKKLAPLGTPAARPADKTDNKHEAQIIYKPAAEKAASVKPQDVPKVNTIFGEL